MNGIFDDIAPLGADMNALRELLDDPACAVRIDEMIRALEVTAQRIASGTVSSSQWRDEQARLYRGFLAAARVIASLREKHGVGGR